MKKKDLKSLLGNKLGKRGMELLRRSYDVVGTIAVIEIPRELIKKEKLIAGMLLKLRKDVKTVVKRSGGHEGSYRIQKYVYLAGEKSFETVHKENNVKLKLDIRKAYFSPRLAGERKRIAAQVKKGENVLVMFSGIAPYVTVIAKNTGARNVTGIELNKAAHLCAVENAGLNGLKNVKLYLGNARKILKNIDEKYDRIIMPLPKSALRYIDVAFAHSGRGTVIHCYNFVSEKDLEKKASEKIMNVCKKYRKKCKILRVVRCGQPAPRKYRVCVDFQIV